MVVTEEALGVDLVDVFRARRTCCEPTVFGDYFDPPNRASVTRGGRQNLLDWLAGDFIGVNLGRS